MLLTTSTRHAWRAELRRAVLCWRTALLAAALAVHLSLEINRLSRAFTVQPGAQGTLALALELALPLMPLVLAAGAFAAFGLVEDYSFGRLAYARQRAGSARSYLLARTLAPAIGLATAVVIGCVLAEGLAFLRLPSGPIRQRPEFRGEPWRLLETGPLTADLAYAGLVALAAMALTVLAGVIARAGRQLATLLLPAAFLVIGDVVGRGPLASLRPAGRMVPDDWKELLVDVAYWLVLGAVALIAAVALARPTPGRTDA